MAQEAQGVNNDSIFFYGFQEGEYGTQGPWIVGWGLYRQHLYYKGWWSGQNIVRYVDGSLGPRSGLVDLGVTSLPANPLNGLGYHPTPGKSGWCVIGTALYQFDAEATGSGATFIGNLGASPIRPLVSVNVGQYVYISNYGDKTYAYKPSSGTLAGITNSPGGSALTAYLDRLIVGCTTTAGNIVWFSDPAPANGGPFTWQDQPSRTVTDASLTNGSPTLTSASANFIPADQGAPLIGAGILAGTTVQSVVSSTTVTMTQNAQATETGDTVAIGTGGQSWASQYFYVGDQWEVRSLNALRTGLAISKQDGSWWVLSGVPGVNDVLRRTWPGEVMGPIWQHRTTATPDGYIWGVGYGSDYPVVFTGAKASNFKYLSFMGGNFADDGAQHVDVGVAGVFQPDEILCVSGNVSSPNTALLRRNGVFSKHLFGKNVSAWIAQGNTGRMLISDGGAVGVSPKIYAWRASGIERPNVAGNNLESVDDAGTAFTSTFTLPEWIERGGGMVMVREVIVEFRSWNTGATPNNHFDLTVTATRRRQLPAGTPVADSVSKNYTYDEAGSAIGTSGTVKNRTITFTPGDQGRGNGFVITLNNVRGVAITRILVKVQTEAATV